MVIWGLAGVDRLRRLSDVDMWRVYRLNLFEDFSFYICVDPETQHDVSGQFSQVNLKFGFFIRSESEALKFKPVSVALRKIGEKESRE